jgi:hypothetical protein
MLNKKSIENLEAQLSQMTGAIKSQLDSKLSSWTLVDKYLQKTGDYSSDTTQGQLANMAGDKTKIANVEIPVTFINKESAHAYMAGTFLTGYPIFAVTATREKEDTASMLTALVSRDQQRMGWIPEFLRAFDDVLRYNRCAVEVKWAAKRSSSVTTKVVPGSSVTGNISAVIYEGNEIKRLDPYNLIIDPTVEPHKVHIDGAYAGYVESVSYIALKRKYQEWNELYTVKKNIGKIIGNTRDNMNSNDGTNTFYRRPIIAKDAGVRFNGQDFSHFWGNNTRLPMSNAKTGLYEIVHLYKRIIPREYEITVPNAGQPYVFYLIWVNGHLAYAEPVQAGHEYLPIVVGQMYPGQADVKSFVEYITDCQDLATSLMSATLNSMRRAVGDRALYDPTRIRKQDIEAPSPVSKIPVQTNAYQNGLEAAYKSIPYEDRISGNFQNLMGVAINLAEKTTGLNGAAQGSFTPGNKTMKEFDTIMSNSTARLQLGATQLDGSFLNPIKEILKLNYLIYAQAESIEDRQTNTVVTIDPVMLREQAPDFKMADGLMPSTKQASTEVLMQAMATMQNNPQLAMEYDMGGMLVSILKQSGLTNLNEYKRTPEQQKQYIQMVQATTAASTPPPQQPQQV